MLYKYGKCSSIVCVGGGRDELGCDVTFVLFPRETIEHKRKNASSQVCHETGSIFNALLGNGKYFNLKLPGKIKIIIKIEGRDKISYDLYLLARCF